MGNELYRLNNYLRYRNTIRRYDTGKPPLLSGEELRKMLSSLQQYDHPDMYAVVGNKVYILEHFEFDASRERKGKGMRGIKEENELSRRIDEVEPDGEWHIDKADYPVTLADFQRNFEYHFKYHYEQIDDYRNNLLENNYLSENNELIVGFWAENKLPPLFQNGRDFCGELYYFATKQFSELLLEYSKVDFMLFGCNCGGPQLFYIDRFTLCPQTIQIDLLSKEISISPINQNEVAMYGAFLTEI